MASRCLPAGVLLLSLQLLSSWSPVLCQVAPECSNGAVRLTNIGVPQNSSGQVEVCSGGEWGAVCDDNWDSNDAAVVCRQLGYPISVALGRSAFDIGPPRPIFLDEVRCLGSEATLLDCPNNGIGNHDCSDFEHAGVICRNTPLVGPECSNGDTRLTIGGSPQNSSGQVEVCSGEMWGAVCDDNWDNNDATVVCRQLGFSVSVALITSFFAIGPPRPIFLDEVGCIGSEATLLDCPNAGIGIHNCFNSEHAGVICRSTPECSDGAVTLTDGGLPQNSSGQVEVCIGGVLGVVCDDNWDNNDATVVCRQLGYAFGEAVVRSAFAIGPPRSIFLDEVGCLGSEATLLDCFNIGIGNPDCRNSEHAGVICSLPECSDGDIRLTIGGVPQNSSGQVEVCSGGLWGVVCDDNWDARDATVVCNELGYSFGEAVRKSRFAIGPPRPIFLDEVRCVGSEAVLLDCPNNGIGNEDCSNNEHAGVICSNSPQCVANAVRLRDDGSGENDGTVEFCLFGQWETICDVSWTNTEAAVVCRQLGRGTDGVTGRFGSEEDAERSFLQFDCNGNEPFLSNCSISTNLVTCSSSAAGVSCQDRQVTGCSDGEIRIASDGISEQFGRVEVCSSGVWGTVCDNQWDDNDATVVCRQLGYTDGVATIESAFRLSTLRPAFLDNVGCTGTESSLLACSGAGLEETTCLANEFAGVACDSGIVERCLDNDNSMDVVSEQFLSNNVFGTCEQFTVSELCSTVYDASTSVFILSERSLSQTQIASQLNNMVTSIMFEEDACREPIIRMVCHFFLPPCGSNNVTFPPTTICQEDCRRVQDTCTRDWTIVQDILGVSDLGVINCFATERAVSPLPSCCTSAGVQQFSVRMPVSAGAIIGGVLAAVFIILVVLFIIAMVILMMKLRRSKMAVQSLQMDVLSSPNSEARAHFELNTLKESQLNASPQLKKSEAVPNPYSRHMLASPTEEVPVRSASDASRKILSRYSANFARQMSRHLKVTKNQLMMEEKIGTGEFGIVYRALLTEHDGERSEVVAVKTLKGLYDHNEIHKIMDESLKMKFFNHPNVLSLIGVCLDTGAAPYIIMPFMANGSLQQYLKKERANLILGENVDKNEVEDVQKRLTVMCLHIAQGMEYLAEQRFIHRDLASRNCMIDEDFVIKIADFGLSEDIYAKSYFRQEKDVSIKLPVKWMAPESLNDGVFSEKTDVWSFGVTCWEVFSGGKSPYPGVDPRSLCEMLDNGERLDKPNNAACPDHMFGVMQECWELDSRDRPTFSEIVTSVASFATNLAGYVDFSEFNPFEPSEHSQRPSRTSMASLDSDLVRSKQGMAASFTIADSDVHVISKSSTLPKDHDDQKKKTKSFSSLSERTKRFLPKKKKAGKSSTTSESALEGVREEPGELAEGSSGGAGIQINILPASVANGHGFLDDY